MAAFAVASYSHPAGLDAARGETDDAHICSVCHEECDDCPTVRGKRTDVTRFPCRHVFHTDCIVQWLQIANTCPTCRHKVDEEANPAHPDNYVDPVFADQCLGGCRGTCLCDDEIEGDATSRETLDSETVALHTALDQLAGSSPTRRGPKMKRPQVSLNRRGLHARGKKAQIGIAGTSGDAPVSPRAADGSSVFETEHSPRANTGESLDAATADQRALEAALERNKIGDGKSVEYGEDEEEEWQEDWTDDESEASPVIPPAPPPPPFASMFNKRVGESPRSVYATGSTAAPRVPPGIKIGKQVAFMFQQVQAELQVSAAMDGMNATTIQAAYRGWVARTLLVHQHSAATRIQAHARGVICRTAERNAGVEAWSLGAVSMDGGVRAHEFLDDDPRLALDDLHVERNSGSAADNYSPARRDDVERMGSFSSDGSAGMSVSSDSDTSLDLGHFEGYASTGYAPPRLQLDLHLDVELATELAIAATAPRTTSVPLACDGPCDALGASPAAVAPPPIAMSSDSPLAPRTPVTPQSPGLDDFLLSAPTGTQDPRIHTRKFSESQLAELRRHTSRKLRGAVPSVLGGKARLDEMPLDEPPLEVLEQTGGACGLPDLMPILEIEAQLATSAFTAPKKKKKGLLRRLGPGGKPGGKKGKGKGGGPREKELAPEAPPAVAPRPLAVPRGDGV